jgi:hypothetical protein
VGDDPALHRQGQLPQHLGPRVELGDLAGRDLLLGVRDEPSQV